MFEPRYKGGVLLNIDFSSLEIHIAAMVAKDPSMIQILLDGDNYHSMTARNIWNLPKDEPVPKDVRSKAKAASFGSIYGESAMGLSSKEGIPLKGAEEVLDGLMKAYPLLDKKIQDTQKMAETKKYVEMISGFRRRLDKINSNDKAIQSRTLRQSFNAVVQGSGAYCTNTALIVLRAIFEKLHLKSLMVLTVHDSIVIDVHPDEIDTVYKICTYVFSHLPIPELNNLPIGNLNVPEELKQSPTTYRFPMVGEAEIGLNYNDDVDFDPEEFKDFASLTGYCKYKYSMLKLNEHLGMYDTEKYTKDDKEEQVTKYKNAIKKLEDNKSLFEKVR